MKTKRVLGLDLGSTAFKMVLLEAQDSRMILIQARMLEIPAQSEEEVRQAALKSLLEGVDLPHLTQVASVVDDPFACVHVVSVPPMPESEQADAVKWELQRFLAVPPEEVAVEIKLLGEEEVDWIAIRDGFDRVRIYDTKGGEATLTQTNIGKQFFYAYAYKNRDPMEYADNKKISLLDGRAHPADDWVQQTAASKRPNGVMELSNLFQNPRVGDILIVTKEPWGYRKVKAGTHGSLNQDDMHIPLFIAGPGIPHGHFKIARGVDLFPTVLTWFGIDKKEWKDQEGVPLFQKNVGATEPNALPLANMEKSFAEGKKIRGKKFLPACAKEITLRQARLVKYQDLQKQLHDPKNPLHVPKKLVANMKWFLAQETDAEEERLIRMEQIQKTLKRTK